MKKWIALLLTAALLAVCCVPAFAAEPDPKYADALKSLGLFQGTDKGYELEKNLTREQGVVMIIRLLGKEKTALACEEAQPFADLGNYAWFVPYAAYAYAEGITKGISETAFGYGSEMTEAMFLTMLLRVLGYLDANDGRADFVWSDPFSLAKTAKIIDAPVSGTFTREAMTERCWNALSALTKDQKQTLAERLIGDDVFTKEQKDEADQKLVGGTAAGGGTSSSGSSSGGPSSSSSSSGGTSSGGSGSGGTSDSTPMKPNETPRVPVSHGGTP